jgi:choline-sulfatase
VLAALEASGQAGNTWIFFTADHGLAVGRHGLFGKQNMYEHSLRVPFIVSGPGVAANRRNSAAIYLQDVMATTLELAGAAPPAHVYFRSFLPLLRDPAAKSRYPAVYGAYLDLQRAVIHDGYKLILYPAAKVARLYHLAQDPLEQHDLAASATHAPVARTLFAKLRAEQASLRDALALAATFPTLSAP